MVYFATYADSSPLPRPQVKATDLNLINCAGTLLVSASWLFSLRVLQSFNSWISALLLIFEVVQLLCSTKPEINT